MIPIQWILVGLLSVAFGFGLYVLRSQLLSRLAGTMIYGAGVLMVLQPEAANRLAHTVGVGRGADLLLYVFVLCSGFFWLSLYQSQRELRRRQTELARWIALENACRLDEEDAPKG